MKPRIYNVTIRKDNNAASKGLYPGSGQTHASGNFTYRTVPIVTGTFVDATQLAKAILSKDEEIECINLVADDIVIDPQIDIDSD